MSITNYTAKYGELDGLFRKYCEKKRTESKSLCKQLEDEVATNVELRKYVAILEAKLASGQDALAQLERRFRDAMTHVDASVKERDCQLREVASDLAARVRLVEQRERECAERTAALQHREEQFRLHFSSFEWTKDEFETAASAFRRAMRAEMVHTEEAADMAIDCLCEIKRKDEDLIDKEQELELEAHLLHNRMVLELEESSHRDKVCGFEFQERSSLVAAFLHEHNMHLKGLLLSHREKESKLLTTTDLLQLHEVEFSSRVRKERDLCQQERSKAELMRDTFILECKRVLSDVSELLDSISEREVTSLRLNLESKLQAMLDAPI